MCSTRAIPSGGAFAVAEHPDVLIVGAGIVGVACARELARAGRSVMVLERDVVGSGATAAGMGHIVVMDDSPAQLQLTHYSQTLWDEVAHQHAGRLDYARCGTIWVAADAEEMQAVHAKRARYHEHGIASEILDEHALYTVEPNLRPGLAGGLLVPGDSVVYPPGGAALLLEHARDHGVTLRSGDAVQLVPDGVRLADGTTVHAEAVVLANGARAVALAPELPIRPKKGHLAITDRYPGFVRHQLVELGYIKKAHAASGDSVAFNVQPRPSGQLLIGSSRQFDIHTGEIDQGVLGKMIARAIAYLPRLGRLLCIRTWTGLRAATPDGLPLIGPDPARPGIWLASGHEGLGITTALGTAQLLTAQMLGRTPEIPLGPYLPSRPYQAAVHA